MGVSFELVYQKYRKRVYSYIVQRINSREDAEDICEDVFLKLHDVIKSYDENRASISTVIYKISHDKVIDYYRTHHEQVEINEDSAVLPATEEVVMDNEMVKLVQSALMKLPEEQRDILLLRYYHGISLKDIAVKMDVPYSTVISKQKVAIGAMEELLKNKT